MSDWLKNHWFKAAVGVLCIVIASVFVYKRLAPSQFPVLGKAPEFVFSELQQSDVSLESTNGKVRVVYFFFANCPDVCGPTTYMLSKVQAGLKEKNVFGNDALMLSITIDPQRDTMDHLAEFAANYQADPSGWLFLRGEEQVTQQVAEKFGVAVLKDDEGNFIHANRIVLVDREGNIRKTYNANDDELTPEQIVDDVERLTDY